jgi:hypothetical protein
LREKWAPPFTDTHYLRSSVIVFGVAEIVKLWHRSIVYGKCLRTHRAVNKYLFQLRSQRARVVGHAKVTKVRVRTSLARERSGHRVDYFDVPCESLRICFILFSCQLFKGTLEEHIHGTESA